MDPDVPHRQQMRILRFLVKKLIGDLKGPEKVLVFRQNESLAANDLPDLRAAVAGLARAASQVPTRTMAGRRRCPTLSGLSMIAACLSSRGRPMPRIISSKWICCRSSTRRR
jgi:hypothetical protein